MPACRQKPRCKHGAVSTGKTHVTVCASQVSTGHSKGSREVRPPLLRHKLIAFQLAPPQPRPPTAE